MTSRIESLRAIAALFFILVFIPGCPEKVKTGGAWKDVEPTVVHRPDDIAAQQGREKTSNDMAKKREADRLKAAKPTDAERLCKADADCVLVNEGCCSCENSGINTAVSQAGFQTLVKRRVDTCTAVCPSVMSDDPSCQATKAACVDGQCQPLVPAGSAAPAGVGVEVIE